MELPKWEYRRITVWGTEGKQSDEPVSQALNAFGQEGWELVAAFYQVDDGYVYLFNRPAGLASAQ
jgi:cytochrome oxidase assembly protein ShyY1